MNEKRKEEEMDVGHKDTSLSRMEEQTRNKT